MNRTIAFLSIICLFLYACNSDEESSARESEMDQLDRQFREIQTLASSANCIDSTDWSYVAYGARACGGPQGYIPYYLKTDTTLLFAQLASYEANERAFNTRWNITSICSVPNEPSGVKCENGNPILVYD